MVVHQQPKESTTEGHQLPTPHHDHLRKWGDAAIKRDRLVLGLKAGILMGILRSGIRGVLRRIGGRSRFFSKGEIATILITIIVITMITAMQRLRITIPITTTATIPMYTIKAII